MSDRFDIRQLILYYSDYRTLHSGATSLAMAVLLNPHDEAPACVLADYLIERRKTGLKFTDIPIEELLTKQYWSHKVPGHALKRIYKLCQRRGIRTVGQLSTYSEKELLSWKDVGRGTTHHIARLLTEVELQHKMEDGPKL